MALEALLESSKDAMLIQLAVCNEISELIPLSAGIGVKFYSQFIPNSTVQQYNLEKLYGLSQITLGRFETVYFPNPLLVHFPNPPRAIWDSVFSKSTSNVFPKST